MDRPLASTSPIVMTDRQRMTLLVTTVFGHALKHGFSAAFFVILPEIKTGLGLSNTQVGTLSTIRNVTGGLANLPGGFLADRFSHYRAVILGISFAFIGIFAFAVGLANTFWPAAIAAALMLIAITFWHPSAISALSVRFADRRGFAISLHGTGGSVGEALGPVITGVALGFFAWQAILQGMIVPTILLGIGFWLILRTLPMQSDTPITTGDYFAGLAQLFTNGKLLMVLGLAGGFAAGQSVFFTFFPIYIREDFGASSLALGGYLFLAQGAGILAQPAMGHLSDRMGRKAVLAPGFALMGLCMLGIAVVPSGPAFIAVIVVLGTVLFSLMAILLAAAGDLVGSGVQGTTISLVFGTAVVISAISPLIGGIIADAYEVQSTFLWAGGVTLVTSVFAAIAPWQPKTD